MPEFDYFSVTFPLLNKPPVELIDLFIEKLNLDESIEEKKGKNSYEFGYSLTRNGVSVLRMYWGGQASLLHVESSGEFSESVRTVLIEFYETDPINFSFRLVRADVKYDVEKGGYFDRMSKRLIKFAARRRPKELSISQVGNWAQSKARTLYIGTRGQPVFFRMYEKGYQLTAIDPSQPLRPDLVRLEAEIRPQKQKRVEMALWGAQAMLTASWLPDLFREIGFNPGESEPIRVNRVSDQARAEFYLLEQYQKTMRKWVERDGWEAVKSDFEKRWDEESAKIQ